VGYEPEAPQREDAERAHDEPCATQQQQPVEMEQAG
jgi:hypothetical protein